MFIYNLYIRYVVKRKKYFKLRKKDLLDKYKDFNYLTAIASILLIGGSVGLALATIDLGQIYLIKKYKKWRVKKK